MASKTKTKKEKTLIIVESPTKARTISKFLDDSYIVLSSFGHVRDLPKSKLGVDPENNFEPSYLIPQKAKANVKILKAAAEKTKEVILATDEDREGEAIAWHITKVLTEVKKSRSKKNPDAEPAKAPEYHFRRIVFHEITQKAILDALAHPRELNNDLVDAQQARRILDRLVGYELSPFLWKKIMRGLSAGRVQSVAVRLIVEREEEIKKFVPQEYWTVEALLSSDSNPQAQLRATLISRDGKKFEKFDIPNKDAADAIVAAARQASWAVANVTKKEFRKMPAPPFTTSTLQQEAAKKLHFSAKQTMMFAQQLYEGVELGGQGSVGLITYMRTDSLNLSEDSVKEAKRVITESFGENYALAAPRKFKTKSKGAQEAHEAVRPTDPARHPDTIKEHLTPQQFRMYDLIWRRFIACQMEVAIFDTTAIDIAADGKESYLFRANGVIKKFAGFLAAYPMKFEDAILPECREGQTMVLSNVEGIEHFTQPPARYTEASLIKALEEHGIGRPSTYAPTLSTIQTRNYVEKNEQRRLQPTDIGTKVNAMLVAHFPQIVDIAFTANMEERLDGVAEGNVDWRKMIGDFYGPFHENLTKKYEDVAQDKAPEEKTDQICEKCGSPMVIKTGRFGRFLACSNFPECKNTKTIRKTIGMTCPQCNEGDIVEKRTKKRRTFWGCSRYPACDFATWKNPLAKEKTEEQEVAAEQEPEQENQE
ncbi:DNA topoisomerase I [Candidatus Azambacteria bacterium RIFCSPHIGHO2_02_FULL_52_12]|uniref:DNA topoisomerase 1 n=1 Tax=Candidatus Azambacteria bacterium RIFCSPLOWO2_01_FULL_46_25 TaxID=1797298 RepID=A0A1F5BU91_9BACT|nr:MAG: DNA topoisomerase I [Candidatus Azambacteria bacterium RIFCSPHIGHO2_02_FULL_52_12]OGD34180.1 MAG: DNA topoisomerase I [Candidatus Azambacteria bacterium RIFCSPLOWO2_01_FULL_46_25]OGD37217.1 MAG: DNA topoisomerase I [Candidatus Azambacteria bacterium RIFCSPHIGHO2_01_FULL_51_74]